MERRLLRLIINPAMIAMGIWGDYDLSLLAIPAWRTDPPLRTTDRPLAHWPLELGPMNPRDFVLHSRERGRKPTAPYVGDPRMTRQFLILAAAVIGVWLLVDIAALIVLCRIRGGTAVIDWWIVITVGAVVVIALFFALTRSCP